MPGDSRLVSDIVESGEWRAEEGRESEAERSSREVRYQAHAWQLSATDPLGLRVDGATALGFILPAFLT